jgi:hypothetical protein
VIPECEDADGAGPPVEGMDVRQLEDIAVRPVEVI